MTEDALFIREELDDKHFRNIEYVVKDIKSYALSNFEHYKAFDDHLSMRFVSSSSFLLEYIDNGLLPEIRYVIVLGRAHDFDAFHPANGYRSLVKLVEKCCIRILTMVRFISNKRSSVFFRHETHSKELETFVNMLGQLKACLHFAHSYSNLLSGQLVVNEYNEELYRSMLQIENLCQEPFFGPCLGFQFCESMQQPLNMMHLLLACYSEGFDKPTAFMKVAASLLHTGKFYLSPELRSKKVVSATLDGDIAFCKSFWSLTENNLLHNLAKFISPSVALETTFNIPTDPVHISLASDPSKRITVHPSSVNGDPLPIPVRLLSYVHRKGQLQLKSSTSKPPSKALVIHCHGGGFIAQSSLSHAGYLRHWAKELDCPIVSIDYSLAPEYAYPRQVEEVFFTYCWILNNLHVFGSTGETIVLVGDSAGANLVFSTVLRIGEKGVRKPDGVLCVYGCFLVRYSPTPSRLLSLSDPILPFGILTKCLTAYIGIDIRLQEHLHKKRKFKRQQSIQVQQEKIKIESKMDLNSENSNVAKSVSENEIKTKEKAHSRWKFTKFFKSNTFDFIKKQRPPLGGKQSKSCEYEDLTLGSKISYKFTTQKSLVEKSEDSQEFMDAEAVLSTPFQSDDSDYVIVNNNGNNIFIEPNKKDEDIIVHKDNSDSKTKESTTKIPQVDNITSKKPSEDCSPSRKASPFTKTSQVTIASTIMEETSLENPSLTKLSPTKEPIAAIVASESYEGFAEDEEQRLIEETEIEIMKQRESEYPDCAIRGTRNILLDMKALRRQLEHTQDPYLSPAFAPDSALKEINNISFVALHLDPLLDETIFMAKRFKSLGCQVSLDIIDDLPHGFLNFMHLSKEAYHASILCGLRLKRLLAAGSPDKLVSESSNNYSSAPITPESPANVDFNVVSSPSATGTAEKNVLSPSSSTESYNEAF